MSGEMVVNKGILDILPTAMRSYAAQLTEAELGYSPEELEQLIKPGHTLYSLRKNIWTNVQTAVMTGKPLRATEIYASVCGRQTYEKAIHNKLTLAWLLQPTKTYDDYMMVMIDMAMERYKDLMGMEITTERRVKNQEGEYVMVKQTCPKKAFVLLQTLKQVEDRALGKPVERQININSNANEANKVVGFDMDKINARLKELEVRLGEGFDDKGTVHLPTLLDGESPAERAARGDIEEGVYEE